MTFVISCIIGIAVAKAIESMLFGRSRREVERFRRQIQSEQKLAELMYGIELTRQQREDHRKKEAEEIRKASEATNLQWKQWAEDLAAGRMINV